MRKYKDRDWLVQTYVIERLGTREIADMFGVSKTTIRKWMIKFGIPRRSNSEASVLSWQHGNYDGEKHPRWEGGLIATVCTNCGKTIYRRPHRFRAQEQFCSIECMGEHKVGAKHHAWKEKITKSCEWCGADIELDESKTGRRFCSRECFGKYHSENHPAKNGKVTQCANCKVEIYRPACDFKKHQRLFCSRQCKDEFTTGENHPLWDASERSCDVCGKVFFASQSNPQHFCSRECYGFWLSENNCGENNPTWRGGISFEPYPPEFNERYKRMIRERDGYKCILCGKATEENGRKLDVHHITYDKGNLDPDLKVSLCRSCHGKTGTDRTFWTSVFTQYWRRVPVRDWQIRRVVL